MPWQWYKPNQGRKVRLAAILGVVLVSALAAMELYGALPGHGLHVKLGLPVLVLIALAGAGVYLLNRNRLADFLIDTEAELGKVSWPSKQQVLGSTGLVLALVVLLGLYLLGLDKVMDFFLRRLLRIYQ